MKCEKLSLDTKEKHIEYIVGELLVNRNLSIAVAESCTGGMVTAALINYPGISKVLKEGFVTYTEESKVKRLGVKKDTLQKYTVVSQQVAEEMAEGVAKGSETDIGLSSTGIAGPGGGTKEQPVGLVYIGLYYKGKSISKKLNLSGDRQEVREKATKELLELLRDTIL